MKTSRIMQISLTAVAIMLGVFAVCLLLAGIDYRNLPYQTEVVTKAAQSNEADTQNLDYKVWRVFPEDKKGITIAIVSVNPKHFNCHDMVALAAQLNKELADRTKLKIGLADDADTARLFVEGKVNYPTYEKAERGRYCLDRDKCREHIQFSTQREQPRKTVKIKCSSEVPHSALTTTACA